MKQRHQGQCGNRLFAEMYQSARIDLVILLAMAGLMALQRLFNRRSAAIIGFLIFRMLKLTLGRKC